MAHPVYKNLIGGEWKPAASGKTILNLNPADHTDVVGEFPASQAEDVADAVAAAKRAYASWRLVPAPKRAEILLKTGLLLQGSAKKGYWPRNDSRNGQKCWLKAGGDVQEANRQRPFTSLARIRRPYLVSPTPSELVNKFAMKACACRSVWSASSLRGTSPWPSPAGNFFRRWSPATPCVIKPAEAARRFQLTTWSQTLIDAGLPSAMWSTS